MLPEWHDDHKLVDVVEDIVDHEPTEADFDYIVEKWTEKRRKEVINEIRANADNRETVKRFTINGISDWFESETRSSLRDKVASERRKGRTKTIIYSAGVGYEMTLEQADDFLDTLQVYAADCFQITEAHEANVKNLEEVKDIDAYDYKRGYPENPAFTEF